MWDFTTIIEFEHIETKKLGLDALISSEVN
jgi:hypothetical protein